jgi:hypothetical protein
VPFCKWVKKSQGDIKFHANLDGSLWLHTVGAPLRLPEAVSLESGVRASIPESGTQPSSISGCEDGLAACQQVELGLDGIRRVR